MKVEFSFNDRTAIILKPECERERSLIRLATIENPQTTCAQVGVMASVDKDMTLTINICEPRE